MRKKKTVDTNSILSRIKAPFTKFSASIQNLFSDPGLSQTLTILKCGVSTEYWTSQIIGDIARIMKKVAMIEAGLAEGGVGVIAPIADILVNFLCNWKAFVLAANSFSTSIPNQ